MNGSLDVNLYCVRLTAIKPGTTQRQKLIVNQVPATDEQMARYEAIKNITKNDPRMTYACVRFVSAKRTDDAFWPKEA